MVANQTPQVTEAATDQDPTTNLLFTPKGYGFELWTHRFSPGGMRLSPGSYGKSGGAGTFMWIDPKRELIAILLTNHGLPVPFDQPGWNLLIDDVAVAEFCRRRRQRRARVTPQADRRHVRSAHRGSGAYRWGLSPPVRV